MKTYKVKFLTQQGIIEKVITEADNLDKLAEAIRQQYGTFVTISSTPLN